MAAMENSDGAIITINLFLLSLYYTDSEVIHVPEETNHCQGPTSEFQRIVISPRPYHEEIPEPRDLTGEARTRTT